MNHGYFFPNLVVERKRILDVNADTSTEVAVIRALQALGSFRSDNVTLDWGDFFNRIGVNRHPKVNFG